MCSQGTRSAAPHTLSTAAASLGVYALGAAEEGGRAAGADEGDDAQAKGPFADFLATAAALRSARLGFFDLIQSVTPIKKTGLGENGVLS
jgi:hypothetical protein